MEREMSHTNRDNKRAYPGNHRGVSDFGWLDSRHSFSFGGYHDPERMGYGPLRVFNDDRVAGGGGFPSHPHRDMEIVSFVLSGELAHKDSMGNGDLLKRGDVQYMSAGSGIVHSEYNGSATEEAHFLQIWIMPDEKGYEPRYEKLSGILDSRRNEWIQILKPEGREGGGIAIRQDAKGWFANLDAGSGLNLSVQPNRASWLQVVEGSVEIDGEVLEEGDALGIAGPSGEHTITTRSTARLIAFDLPQIN